MPERRPAPPFAHSPEVYQGRVRCISTGRGWFPFFSSHGVTTIFLVLHLTCHLPPANYISVSTHNSAHLFDLIPCICLIVLRHLGWKAWYLSKMYESHFFIRQLRMSKPDRQSSYHLLSRGLANQWLYLTAMHNDHRNYKYLLCRPDPPTPGFIYHCATCGGAGI